MRFGVSLPNFGSGVDAAAVAEWARAAEAAGWDGLFLWDHLFAFAEGPVETVDPWIALTAAAYATTTIRLGTLVTPLPRRRPVVVARQTASLDRLSGGRLVLGVGSGAFPFEWDYLGEETDPRVRGEMLDEHLGLLDRLWTGEQVRHEGAHYRVAGPDWGGLCWPPPVQQPRIPVWVAARWPNRRPLRRALKWDGVFPIDLPGPDALAELAAAIRAERDGPFDVVVTNPAGEDVRPWVAAGATWCLTGFGNDPREDEVRAAIEAGPAA